MNITARLEFELAYSDVTIMYISYNTVETPSSIFLKYILNL